MENQLPRYYYKLSIRDDSHYTVHKSLSYCSSELSGFLWQK